MSTSSDGTDGHSPRALAFVLWALLLDAAAETWWSGSPVRWWVVAAAATDAAATALLWRRITWQSKAAISLCVFLGVVAMTAWLPGGLSMGVRLAGRRTSTLLSLLSAAAVALSAVVVWRFRAVPRAARTGVGVLAAYGLIAFAYGAIGDVPFADLFSGDSVWQRLPALLQGAFVGGVIVVPLALLTSVVRAGIPRLREGSPRCALYQIVALGTSLAIVLAALPLNSQRRSDAGPGTTTAGFSLPAMAAIVPSPALSDALENSLRAIADGERESAHDRWDPAYIVEQVGKEPRQLFDWVAGNTFWIPYRGLLRGPVGVLMDRMGNNLDRAVLLATLLEQAGHAVRLAHGELATDRAADLLPSLVVARHVGLTRRSHAAPPDAGEIRQVAAKYDLNGPVVERTLAASAADGERAFSSLDARVIDQTERLRAAVASRVNTDHPTRVDIARALLRDHWWVQWQDAGAWIDLDLLSPDMKALTSPQETVRLGALSAAQVHQVIVRVVAEQWREGKVAERIALQHALRPAELIGKPIVLQFWPRRWPRQFPPAGADPKGSVRATALAQHEWVASLQIGRDNAARSSLQDNGDVNDHPMMNDFAKIGGSAAGAADSAAGLLGSLGSEQPDPPASKAILTAAWFEFEIRAPGEPPRTIRRPVFDLLGPSARGATPVPRPQLDEAGTLRRSLSLMMETEILPIVSRISDEFVTHLLAQSVQGNRETFRALVHGEFSETSIRPEEAFTRLVPMPGPLYTLARARLDWNRFDDEIYIDTVDILTRHLFFAQAGERIAVQDATDIVANGVGVDLSVEDTFAARLEQGVLDTNAEALLQRGSTIGGSAANAFAASNDWVTLASANDSQLASLRVSDDDRRQIVHDLEAGSIVVAPKAPVRLGQDEFVGWWLVNPATGQALGVDRHGWGAAMGEYALLLEGAFIGFYLAYIECRAGTGPGVQGSAPTDVAGGWAPYRNPGLEFHGLDSVFAPLSAAVSPCLGIAFSAAAIGALLGKLAASSRGGGAGGPGGRSTSGGSGSSGGGGGSNGGGANPGSGAAGSGPGSGRAGGGRAGGGGATPSSGGGSAGQGGRASGTQAPATPPKGPYQSDPYGKQLVNQNPNSDASKMMGRNGGVMDGADQAAQKAYSAGKQMGMTDDAAHDLSRQTYDNYVNRWGIKPGAELPPDQTGINQLGGTAPAGGKGGTLPLQSPSPSPCAVPPCGVSPATRPIGGGPSPQAKSVGGLANLGNVLKGGSQ